jgi:hypothetical protein
VTTLGRLERVDLRYVWTTEAQDFTPWLAREENLTILADAIGIELELEATEKDVGPFRADILCRDTATGDWVLIENQLERTDHLHLGQLLTYAAGLQAATIVWISSRFTEEHRATLDWLNEITGERFNFFGLEVELWKIGDSPPAPKFNAVSQPNDWSRSVGQAAKRISDEPMSETEESYVRFWAGLRDRLMERDSPIRPVKPPPENWTMYGVGRTGFSLLASFNTRENWLRTELFIHEDKDKSLFRHLQSDREAIEREFGEALEWEELPSRKGSRVATYLRNTDPMNEELWPRHHEWIAENLERLNKVFRPRVKGLNLSSQIAEQRAEHVAE